MSIQPEQQSRHPAHWQSRIGQYSEMLINAQMLNAHRKIAEERDYDNLCFLDAGCGGGGLTRDLIDTFGNPERVFGCDIEPECIATCQRMNPAANYFRHNLLEPLPEGQRFDMVFMTTALAQFSVEQQKTVLTNIRKQLNPEAYLFIVDVNTERTERLFRCLKGSADYEVVYNRNFVRRYFGKMPGVMLADKLPLPLLQIMEHVVPGSNTLQLMVVKVVDK